MRSKPWTADDVCREMPNAFRILPAVPLQFGLRDHVRDCIRLGTVHRVPGHGDAIARVLDPSCMIRAAEIALASDPTARRHFFAWARISGTGSKQELAEYRRAVGLSLSMLKRKRPQWCALVAVELNLELGLGPDGPAEKLCA